MNYVHMPVALSPCRLDFAFFIAREFAVDFVVDFAVHFSVDFLPFGTGRPQELRHLCPVQPQIFEKIAPG